MAQDTPRRGIDTTAAVVEGAADGLADGIDREGLDRSLPHLAGEVAPIAQRGARSQRLRARLEQADEKVAQAIDRTRHKARAVAESARRARKAPGHLLEDAREAVRAYVGGLAASAGLYAAAGAVALVAAILLTVGLVQGLNRLWGRPWGTFAVAVLYAVGALALAASARGRAEAGRREARERVADARREARHVAEPVREAFRAGRETPSHARVPPPAGDRGTASDPARSVQADIGADPHHDPSDERLPSPSHRM